MTTQPIPHDHKREQLVLKWTIQAIESTKKYKQLSATNKSYINTLAELIAQDPQEIIFRKERMKLLQFYQQHASNDYIKDNILYNVAQEKRKVTTNQNHYYPTLASSLNITTKHLFHLIHLMDQLYDIRQSMSYTYLKNNSVKAQDKKEYYNKLIQEQSNAKVQVSQDYQNLLLGQYPSLN